MSTTLSIESTSKMSITTPRTTKTTDKSSEMSTKSASPANTTKKTTTAKPEEEEEDEYNYEYDPYEYDEKTDDTSNDFVELISENADDNEVESKVQLSYLLSCGF